MFGTTKRTSEVIYEDTEVAQAISPEPQQKKVYIEPRIYKTWDRDTGFASGKEFEFSYKYDKIGRIAECQSSVRTEDSGPVSSFYLTTRNKYDSQNVMGLISKVELDTAGFSMAPQVPSKQSSRLVTQNIQYDDRGNLTEVIEEGEMYSAILRYSDNHEYNKTHIAKKITYGYDAQNRVIHDKVVSTSPVISGHDSGL